MITVSETDRRNLLTQGWVSVDLNVDPALLMACEQSIYEMRRECFRNWPHRRIYFDYLGTRNIAAIELPFHKDIIRPPIKKLFGEIKIGAAVSDLMGWESHIMSLCRVFTMSGKKYQGNWHRDSPELPGASSPNSIQVAIFLKDQPGFRILKPEYDLNGSHAKISEEVNVYLKDNVDSARRFNTPLTIERDYYTTLEGKAGTAVFFDSRLLHQGYSTRPRCDFHMRFEAVPNWNYEGRNFVRNPYQDFFSKLQYGEFCNPDALTDVPYDNKPRNILKSIIVSASYYFPVRALATLIRNMGSPIRVPPPFKLSPFANTFFQGFFEKDR